MKMELKSIGYWSLLKISFVVNLVIGFLMGLFFAIFTGLFMTVAEKFGGLSGMGMASDEFPSIGIMIILYPIMFSLGAAFFNTILYLIIAFVYNMTAKLLGGIELSLNEVIETPPTFQNINPRPSEKPLTSSDPPPPIKPLPDDIGLNDLSGDE
ncbi:MAG: DUF3566 domain-containing protein [Candidatus Zixiibacteriota bacterium]